MAVASSELIERTADALAALRSRRPRVQCLTNTVAQPITANLLLAVGARVSLATHPAEVADMSRTADALLINLGTLDPVREAAIPRLLEAIDPARQPLVLDPVFADLSPLRYTIASAVLRHPSVIVRGNASEMAAIAGLSARAGVRITTGAVDYITDGAREALVANGHPLMAAVTGVGCACGALIAACAAVEPDRMAASIAALIILGASGEIAAERAQGPGTFAAHLIDAVAGLDARTLTSRARLS